MLPWRAFLFFTVPTSYSYDKFGRPASVQHNSKAALKTSYSYNVRSWLSAQTGSLFGQNLTYDSGGNIATQQWTQNGNTRTYTYGYDGLERLKSAAYSGSGNFSTAYTYDKAGNVKTLQRYNSSLIDNLTYTLSGNRVTKVEDAAGSSGLFSNGSTATTEYTYDNNGNLKSDLNKGISNITYNSLNLPLSMTFSNGSTIAYTYDANGRKLRTVHNVGGTTTTTDYAGNVVYENGVQKKLLTEEGYVDISVSTPVYYYYLKDHQGNNRVVVNGSGTVAETNHYYPFGGTFASGSLQPYKYNGKELDTKAGLNWYDYGARHYDAALGRFTTQDPLAEKYFSDSPYTYCGSNPVNRIDPTGMDWYEDSHGNMFWQEGHGDVEGYTNIGASVTIGWGDDIFYNYYQNMGIFGDSPTNAVDLIASSPLLMQQAFGRNSGLSETSQLELFSALQSWNKADIGQTVGLFVVGELTGGIIGKAAGWALGKAAGNAVKGYTKSNLKLGQQMHKMYKINEVVEGIAVKEYGKIKGIRPDFVDFKTNTIYELKPNNPKAIKQGWKQLHKYQQMFQQEYGGNWNIVLDLY